VKVNVYNSGITGDVGFKAQIRGLKVTPGKTQ